MRYLLLTSAACLLASCATILIPASHNEIELVTHTRRAKIYFNGEFVGRETALVKMETGLFKVEDNKQSIARAVAIAVKRGCKKHRVKVPLKINWLWWGVGNIFFVPVIGHMIDIGSGYWRSPAKTKIRLKPKCKGRR